MNLIFKEGVGLKDMVSEWLTALVSEAKAKAELDVLKERQQDILINTVKCHQ